MKILGCIPYIWHYVFKRQRFGSRLVRFLILIVLEIPYVFPKWFYLKINQFLWSHSFEPIVLFIICTIHFFSFQCSSKNSIMPQLDLTDIVSIIFSISFLQARTAAAGPHDEGGGQAAVQPDWIQALALELGFSITREIVIY